jgi:hypothetical protein
MAAKKVTKKAREPRQSTVEVPERVVRKPKGAKNGPEKVERKVEARTASGAKTPWFALEGKAAANELISWVTDLRTVELAPYRRDVLENMRLYAGLRTSTERRTDCSGSSCAII